TDSLAVAYTFTNQTSQKASTDTLRIAPLPAGDTAIFSISTATVDRVGSNDLSVNVNPRLLPEQSYHNNRADLPNLFTVVPDATHPVLDVAFDGKYINNGDVVSPRPLIEVVLRDENPILRKQDTAGVHLYLRKNVSDTVESTFVRVRLSADNVTVTPATDTQPFTLVYQPELEDGMYTLRVQAEDASENPSGAQPYEISFVVINRPTITCYYPYPNPLTQRTSFTYTLTGSEVPERLAVQIMNVTGQVVREITADDFGTLRPGSRNVGYDWDGRDRFGNPLPNGMYLYRTVVEGATNFELLEPSEDRTVSSGVGKLFILR
ncbi:MAG: FlgD immunoglobulin-like domain containing protein, partial [Pacificimonas sp.]